MIRPAARTTAVEALTAAVLLALGLLVARPLGAQTDSSFDGVSDEELADEGWAFRDEPGQPGSVTGGVVALTLGAVLRGAGHFTVGDRDTWLPMIVAQPVGVGLVAGGAVLARVGAHDQLEPLGSGLAVLGASLLAVTWASDVLGTFKGGGSDLPTNTAESRGFAVEALYTTTAPSSRDTSNVLVVRLPLITRRLVLRPEVQATTTLDFRQASVTLGYRQPIGRSEASWVQLDGFGLDQYIESAGTGRFALGGDVVVSLDVGEVFGHLRGLVWQNGIGVLADHTRYDVLGNDRLDRSSRRWLFPVESRLSVNVSPGVNVGGGYRHRRDLLVGGVGRTLGVFDLRLTLVPRNRLGIDIAVEQGERTRIWLGVRVLVAQPRAVNRGVSP